MRRPQSQMRTQTVSLHFHCFPFSIGCCDSFLFTLVLVWSGYDPPVTLHLRLRVRHSHGRLSFSLSLSFCALFRYALHSSARVSIASVDGSCLYAATRKFCVESFSSGDHGSFVTSRLCNYYVDSRRSLSHSGIYPYLFLKWKIY